MLVVSNLFSNICSIEDATVTLRSQLKNLEPVRGVQASHEPDGFAVFKRFIDAKGPGRGQTLAVTLLDRVNSVLGHRKPRGSTLIFWGLFFSFFLCFLLGLVFFLFSFL